MPYNRRIGQTNMSFSKLVSQCLIRTLLSLLITLIIYMSITFVVTGANYKAIGYDVLYSKDGVNFETVYTYMYTGEELCIPLQRMPALPLQYFPEALQGRSPL